MKKRIYKNKKKNSNNNGGAQPTLYDIRKTVDIDNE